MEKSTGLRYNPTMAKKRPSYSYILITHLSKATNLSLSTKLGELTEKYLICLLAVIWTNRSLFDLPGQVWSIVISYESHSLNIIK